MRETPDNVTIKFPVSIKGFAGEHDEAGAIVIDAEGKMLFTTARLESNTPEGWLAYHANANFIVYALNNVGR